jgi:putative PIN family toxin of toxin-antitoxin system
MTNNAKFRVVLDTNQIVSAGSRWLASNPPTPTTPVQRFLFHLIKHHVCLYSSSIVAEYLEKLIDRKHPQERVIQFIGCVLNIFELVIISTNACPVKPSDPDDEKFILCALDGQAHFLVTDDHHLLTLKPSYNPPVIGKREELEHHFGRQDEDKSAAGLPAAVHRHHSGSLP